MASSHSITLATYNMHGMNQGQSVLSSMCNPDDLNIDFILLQEHWLTPHNIHKIIKFSDLYVGYGISAMNDVIGHGLLRGRPYGGVCTLIKAKFAKLVSFVHCSDRFVCIVIGSVLLINAYFPKVVKDNDEFIVQSMLDDIQDIVSKFSNCSVIFAADFNIDICKLSEKSDVYKRFVDLNNLISCNGVLRSNLDFTYHHESLQHFSYIDFINISKHLSNELVDFKVLDLPNNLSDHLPVMARLQNILLPCIPEVRRVPPCVQRNLRWDYAALPQYYESTRVLLQPVLDKLTALFDSCICDVTVNYYSSCTSVDESNVNSLMHECHRYAFNSVNNSRYSGQPSSTFRLNTVRSLIRDLYHDVVFSLKSASDICIPAVTSNFFKYWWDEEMNILKQNSCSTHSSWINAGRPGAGPIYEAKRLAKLAYKNRIRDHKQNEKTCVSNDLHNALINKSQGNFWKVWKKKFGKSNSVSPVVEGLSDDLEIANSFAQYFSAICKPDLSDSNNDAQKRFVKRFAEYRSTALGNKVEVDVEMIDNVINSLKNGKAAGVDSLTAEHLKFSHPIIVKIISILFNLMFMFEYVPEDFGVGILIPIPKSDSKSGLNKHSDYRGITISPVISKILEHCVLKNIANDIASSELQFGFKTGRGCNHAIYTVRSVVDYFVSNNSTVNLCTLDISKAFDKVHFPALFLKLIDRNVPCNIISLLLHWYENSVVAVKWNNCMSDMVKLTAGVRQGGVLSPYLFACLVDGVLVKLSHSKLGCCVHSLMLNAIMYADDLMLLSISLSDLQAMVDICVTEFRELGLSINISKSKCLRIGPRHKSKTSNIKINDHELEWTSELKYLGVSISKACSFKCSLHSAKQQFFRALNGIFSKIGTNSSMDVTLSLVNAFCNPVLLYGIESINVNASVYSAIESAYASVFSKLFNTFNKDIIDECSFYCGVLPIRDTIDCRRISFLLKLQSVPSLALGMLFLTRSKKELDSLLVKHNIPVQFANVHKTIIRQQFINKYSH